MNHPSIPKPNPNANVRSVDDLMRMEVVIVDANACNDTSLTVLDLSSFSTLKVFEVGDYSFAFVNEVKLMDLSKLESVMIGKNCFTKHRSNRPKCDPNRHFYLKNCERLRELKMGSGSFSDYSVCEIENTPSLEVIEMGKLNEWSYNFCFASLTLRSEIDNDE